MEQQAYNQLISFIWNIANDCLVGIYNKGDYRKIILPMIVIRRFDAVLEPTKDDVLKMKKSLDEAKIPLSGQEDALKKIAKEQFVNSSPFTLKDLKSRTNQQQLKKERIAYGSTISNDAFARETFDFMISNPPFGTPWKKDLEAWGYSDKKEITDSRFVFKWKGDPEYSVIPNIGDPQMLFLANNISKMKTKTALGSRIVEVHNGSSLFTGSAGQGESNLRRYIIEEDWLEAIVALPENMFYNTGIGTYLWIVTN